MPWCRILMLIGQYLDDLRVTRSNILLRMINDLVTASALHLAAPVPGYLLQSLHRNCCAGYVQYFDHDGGFGKCRGWAAGCRALGCTARRLTIYLGRNCACTTVRVRTLSSDMDIASSFSTFGMGLLMTDWSDRLTTSFPRQDVRASKGLKAAHRCIAS
ncbi:hypothetical protein EJ03DRAFT_205719 [Teratosphaeria nubilosa]|uniref:Uncharacterized protein n=1 Tax=Teratosphaeria nubilosa TaxID=161662 RepID=A0A6G1KZ94_9PEZI|nr:hypothetical protein EJ03DRAFT_205719 [Teratosphaeria nubilosa]